MPAKKKPKPEKLITITRTDEEQALVDKWRDAQLSSEVPRAKINEDNPAQLEPRDEDKELWVARIAEILGTPDHSQILMVTNELANTVSGRGGDAGLEEGLAIIRDIAPTDSLELMLATQMIATHRTAMEQLNRAQQRTNPPEMTNQAVNRANKLLSTFTRQLDALKSYRGKQSQQKVTVEHVHVYEGGQAVVGAVNGRGGIEKS